MRVNDQKLVRETLAGKSEAFGDLVERYGRLVHGIILHKVRQSDEVEDLVQDVFCKAYQELSNLREHEKFAPWLARMASNRAQAWIRQRGVRQICQQNEGPVPRCHCWPFFSRLGRAGAGSSICACGSTAASCPWPMPPWWVWVAV